MKTWLPIIVGVVLVLMGGLWALQGLGYVGGSVMSGAGQWIWIGLAVLIVGLLLAVPALLRIRRRS
ncbi:hypothetical protein SAMN05216276_1003110 [Streptosporangium subroseum]|uniref:Uncharacterized protein n=1 Tax=Streptosporangium subroseum TaxID=106412 RepID=A0A239BD13_9ACTN|nr:hypothetical protein [Streptosporangium subroseum]SNS05471.1 hypothetical protein SAMN05216276_1003110 [Streptosporangium subroseum]